jgi:hypothetical protein
MSLKVKTPLLSLTVEYRVKDESLEISFIVAFETGVLSTASCKVPFNDCAFTVEEIKQAIKKQNKNLFIDIVCALDAFRR